jgi:hypothetical protein
LVRFNDVNAGFLSFAEELRACAMADLLSDRFNKNVKGN